MAPLPPSLSYPESLRGSALSLLKKALGIEAKSVSSSTSRTQLPSGFLTLKHSKMLGYGPQRWEEAVRNIFSWRMHNSLPLLRADATELSEDSSGRIVGLHIGPVHAECIILDVERIEHRWACFSYGTTDKHPEQGEECFAVSMDKRGAVRGYVYAVSKPKRLIGYLGVPAQHLAAKLYLRGM